MRVILVLLMLWGAAMSGVALGQETRDDIPLPRPRPADVGIIAPENLDGIGGVDIDESDGGPATPTITEPQPVTLTAQIAEGGATIPEGLTWRIFDTRTDASGQLALLARSDDAAAIFSLAPGRYVVHVAYGRAQATDTLEVEPGPNIKAMTLDAGALRLSAAVTGDIPIPINLVRFDILTGGAGENRELVAQNVTANDVVTLNAGVYHIVSYFGDVNAVVRADLRVEPGQLTEATLYHQAGQVSFRLVSEVGGEAIADVEWTVQSASGETIFTNLGAFPATVLSEGDYTVFAKRGDTVFNRAFQVMPGPAQEIEVLTAVTGG